MRCISIFAMASGCPVQFPMIRAMKDGMCRVNEGSDTLRKGVPGRVLLNGGVERVVPSG